MSYRQSPTRSYGQKQRNGPEYSARGYLGGAGSRHFADEYSYHEELTSGPRIETSRVDYEDVPEIDYGGGYGRSGGYGHSQSFTVLQHNRPSMSVSGSGLPRAPSAQHDSHSRPSSTTGRRSIPTHQGGAGGYGFGSSPSYVADHSDRSTPTHQPGVGVYRSDFDSRGANQSMNQSMNYNNRFMADRHNQSLPAYPAHFDDNKLRHSPSRDVQQAARGPPGRRPDFDQYGAGGDDGTVTKSINRGPRPVRSNNQGSPGYSAASYEQPRPTSQYQQHEGDSSYVILSDSSRLQETSILGDDSDAEAEEEREMVLRGRGVSEDVPGGSSSEDDFDDPEFLEQQERDRIIQMYETGPENKDIDSWENPDFDLYKKLDRYGFVHKDGSPASKAEVDQRRRVEREIRREKKWLAMLRQWESRKPVKKFEERIWKGIPEKLRITLNKRRGEQNLLEEKLWSGLSQKRREFVWPRLLGIEELKRQSKGEKVYSELLVRARLVSKDIKQIDLDINRTYRDHLAFRRRYDVKQQSLLNVLAAYSMYNTEVGYCQGMSQIAALFLMYLDEEDAFWCMHSLMVSPKHAMHGFFVPGFPKLQRFEAHFKKVLKKYKPRVYKHLDKQDIPYIYLTKWWFGCFLDRVPFSLALRLWDTFLLEGDVILTAMALNIMKMHEKSIRKLGIENFMEFIQTSIANDFGYPDDVTMNSLREVLTKLRSDRLHRPPPPDPKDLPEVPTKIFGPVLAKSMADIRSHVAEVHSRCSRANSVATGRTPQTRRRTTNRAPPSPTPLRTPSRTDSNSAVNRMRSDPSAGMRPLEKEVPFEVPLRRTPSDTKHWPSTPPPDPRQPATMTTTTAGQQYGVGRPAMGVPAAGILSQQYQNQNSPNRQQSMSNSAPSSTNKSFTMREGRINSTQGAGVMRQGSTSNDQSPTDGINKNRSSMYDNVSNGGGATMNHRDDVTGKMVTVMRGSDEEEDSRGFNRNRVIPTGEPGRHRRAESERSHESAAKVRHAPNNVTYVCIGDDDDGQTSDV